MLCGENMVSRKSKIVFPVKVSSTHCGPVTVKFYELPFAERKIAKLDWISTICSVVKCPGIFIFIQLCLIFSGFLILFIYLINIVYWQVLYITVYKIVHRKFQFLMLGIHCSCTCSTIAIYADGTTLYCKFYHASEVW